MSELDEVLKHRYIYVPRGATEDTIEPGKQLALAVARRRGARLTVLAPMKNSATHHDELARMEIVTERSGHVNDDGVVLAWCPTYKAMEKIQHLERSVVVLVEWIPDEFDAWARVKGAYNVVTGEVMDTGLPAAALKVLESIVSEGYNGWHDDFALRITMRHLDDLARAGNFDRALVLARQTKSERSIEKLTQILEQFDAAMNPRPTATGHGIWPSREW